MIGVIATLLAGFVDLAMSQNGDFMIPAAKCLKVASSTLQYPQDAEAHFNEIHTAMGNWTQKSYHQGHFGAGYGGPWIENWWISNFTARLDAQAPGKPLRAIFGPYVPLFIPWVDRWVFGPKYPLKPPFPPPGQGFGYKYPDGFIETLLSVLRPNVAYITVSQNDEGVVGHGELPMSKLPNVLVLSAGGYGHVPVPLFKQVEKPLANLLPMARRPYLVSYVGSMKHAPKNFRRSVQSVASGAANSLHAKTAGWGTRPDWRALMGQSKASLCPRGFGRTAYHLMETVQMGLIPIHVYSDVPWVPYEKVFAKVGFTANLRSLPGVLRQIHSLSAEELEAREEMAKVLTKSHFSYEGTMDQIAKFLADPDASDLRCVGLPSTVKDGRR